MSKAAPLKELNVLLVGSNSSHKNQVGNIILGRQAFVQTDSVCCCERVEGEVGERRVTLVRAPGWLRGYDCCNTPQLLKTEAVLSATPGLHGFLLAINAELTFKNVYLRATQEHLQNFFGDTVWRHTVVVFIRRSAARQKSIEDYIRREGAPLQTLLKACGNRYHVFHEDDGADGQEKVGALLEKIDAMVAENRCYEVDSGLKQRAQSERKRVDEGAAELSLQSQQQRQKLRSLLVVPAPKLRILMVGWVFSGKSAAGKKLLSADVFQAGDRTVKASKRSGVVAGREVVIVDTPGWWKFFPAMFTPSVLKSEILSGVSLCNPSPNVILLAVPSDTSFTREQKRVVVDNMRLLGHRAWRHVIVLFTFGGVLKGKTIEQHIEGEGPALRWLVDKCENRYHVLDSIEASDDDIRELVEKMEEMVAGNQSFYLSPYSDQDDPQHGEDTGDASENQDETTTQEITEQLTIEWDRKNWEWHHSKSSMGPPPVFDEDQDSDESSDEDDQPRTLWGVEVQSEDNKVSSTLNTLKRLLEREWSRREVAEEHHARIYAAAMSDTDSYELHKSRAKVQTWLNTNPPTSDYGTASNITCRHELEDED